jgi:hypothetical protein
MKGESMLGLPASRTGRSHLMAILGLLLPFNLATAQEVQQLLNGHWYDGSGFVPREFYTIEGILREDYDGADARVVDLDGAYVVPGFGNAHSHGIGNNFSTESDQFLRRGVFYVANPNSIASRTLAAREKSRATGTVDARFANGGLTSTGGHPVQIFERSPESKSMDGDAYFTIDSMEALEQRWPDILSGNPDFLKIYLERSEHHALRRDDPEYYGRRGLNPILVPPIVERAHAAGLRVAAHVTSRLDFRIAVESDVDEIAHLPLETLEITDAQIAATKGTVIVTTVLSHRPSDGVRDLDALHRNNLKLLRDAGVSIVLGTDSQATVIDELHKLASLDVFDSGELVHMLVYDTPRWIFPGRNLGTLSDGAEANFVLLEANPLEDLNALTQVTAVFKGGNALELQAVQAEEKSGIGQHLANLIMSRGWETAVREYHRLRAEESDQWDFTEGQLDALGYALMKHGKLEEATAVFQLNCEQYPESANAWDSLGESYIKRGDREAAIETYERSLKLNPENENALSKLKELRGQ